MRLRSIVYSKVVIKCPVMPERCPSLPSDTHLMALFPGLPGQYQKGKTSKNDVNACALLLVSSSHLIQCAEGFRS